MTNNELTKKPNYPIESVDNALKLLLLFREQKAISVSEASKMIGVAPSTAHRLLSMLQYHGFVSQDAVTRVYEAGPALIEVGLSVVREMDIRGQARPFMVRLSTEVGETVHLAILQGQDILFLESIESQKALRVASRIGVHLPANCTAGGKALRARLSQEELREIFPSEQLPTLMPRSLASREELERELEQVRERGYATNHDESEPSVSAVAAVIEDGKGRPRAALTVSAPVSRLNKEQEEVIAAALRRTVAEIGRRVV
jgi:IclR family transcriptional regulator, acetate operon repressor